MNNRIVKWLALGLFLALAAAMGAFAVERVEQAARASDNLREQPFAQADALLRAHVHIHDLHTSLRDAILAGNTAEVLALQHRDTDHDRALTEALDRVVTHEGGDERIVMTLVHTLSAWRDNRERVTELSLDGRWQDATFLLRTEGERLYSELHTTLDAALDSERARAERLRDTADQTHSEANALILVLAVLAAGALAATGVGLATMVLTYRPLQRLSGRLLALAEGDLYGPIPYLSATSPVGTLARAIAHFRQGMAERDAAFRALGHSQEQLRRAMEDVCRANEAKARFLSAASHDLRQPLQALRLYLDTLDRRIDTPLDRRILAGALEALSAGEDLLRNFLDVSVLEAGIVQPEIVEVPLPAVLAAVHDECRPLAAEKELELRLHVEDAVIRTDPALLKRLLCNLVVNAIRYTDTGGVLLACRRRGGQLRIEVWDTGIGIPPDQVRAVFEDFYQIGNPERDRAKGLGLGLSVVQRTAILLGHPITVRSRPGRGSMFAVTVQLSPADHRTKGSLVAA